MNILLSSLIAGLLTGLGAIIVVSIKKINKRIVSFSLGFASGIMIGVSLFHLLKESIQIDSIWYSLAGILIGFIFMHILEKLVPHHPENPDDIKKYQKLGYLIALGIAIHNFPEGIAIGASSGISEHTGLIMAILIGLHNIVEGLAVSIPLYLGNTKKSKTILITTLTGLSTLFGAAVGLYLINISTKFIALSLSFAAGAMIYISLFELIPHSLEEDKKLSFIGIIVGLIISILI